MVETVDLTVRDGIAWVTMQREPVNALNIAMRHALIEIFDEISERDDVRVAVLQSACRVFCAGVDLRDRPDGFRPGAMPAGNRLMRSTFDAIHDCAKPVIGALAGAAIGAGFAMAVSCDILIAAEDVKIQMPEINVGLGGGAAVLHSVLGKSRARRMFFTGEPILTQELDRLGALECVPADKLESEVARLAATIAAKSPEAMCYAKRSSNLTELLGDRECYRQEQEFTTLLSRSATALAAREAALRK
jgi:enoyl-CoA hydratase